MWQNDEACSDRREAGRQGWMDFLQLGELLTPRQGGGQQCRSLSP